MKTLAPLGIAAAGVAESIEPLSAYMRAIGQVPLLTADQELSLGRRVVAGEKKRRARWPPRTCGSSSAWPGGILTTASRSTT